MYGRATMLFTAYSPSRRWSTDEPHGRRPAGHTMLSLAQCRARSSNVGRKMLGLVTGAPSPHRRIASHGTTIRPTTPFQGAGPERAVASPGKLNRTARSPRGR